MIDSSLEQLTQGDGSFARAAEHADWAEGCLEWEEQVAATQYFEAPLDELTQTQLPAFLAAQHYQAETEEPPTQSFDALKAQGAVVSDEHDDRHVGAEKGAAALVSGSPQSLFRRASPTPLRRSSPIMPAPRVPPKKGGFGAAARLKQEMKQPKPEEKEVEEENEGAETEEGMLEEDGEFQKKEKANTEDAEHLLGEQKIDGERMPRALVGEEKIPAVAEASLQSVGHTLRPEELGWQVRVKGDGWGGNGDGYVGVVLEADDKTYTLVNNENWEESHVLKAYCSLLRKSNPESAKSTPQLRKPREEAVFPRKKEDLLAKSKVAVVVKKHPKQQGAAATTKPRKTMVVAGEVAAVSSASDSSSSSSPSSSSSSAGRSWAVASIRSPPRERQPPRKRPRLPEPPLSPEL